jgi:hypothetical protein
MWLLDANLDVHVTDLLRGYGIRSGARLAVINTGETPLDSAADWVFRGAAGEALPQLL